MEWERCNNELSWKSKNYAAKQGEELLLEAEKEVKATKIEDEVVLLMRKRGMVLGYVAPQLKHGIPTAKLNVA